MNIDLKQAFSCFRLPSPIQQLEDPFFSKLGICVDIKRDDLIHPFVSGNKWRKLKGLISHALDEKKEELITFGGAYSNHLLALACAGAIAGLKTTGFVRGEKTATVNDTLYLCQLFGMKLEYLSREVYRQHAGINQFQIPGLIGADHENALIIPEGGVSIQALEGCAELVNELVQEYDHLVISCGTATTAAGISNGFARKNAHTRVEAIVVLKGGEYIENEIKPFLEPSAKLNFHHNYHRGGYAKSDDELNSFIKGFCRQNGILLEPVYTGKSFMAMMDLADKGYFKPGSRVLYVHTGGLIGALGFNN